VVLATCASVRQKAERSMHHTSPGESGRRAWPVRYAVPGFYVLTFGIEFGVLFALLTLGIPTSARAGVAAVWVALYAPTIAAILLTGLEGGGAGIRALLRKFAVWRVGIQW
jgi:hypothetical protein